MAHDEHGGIERLLGDDRYASAAADAMQALAAPSRLRILARLHEGPVTVSELAAAVGMEGSAVSHQLRLLRHLGLVVGQREGRRVVYELHDDHVAEMLEQVVAHVDHVERGISGRAMEAVRDSAAPLTARRQSRERTG
jgi:ArsR family transcriptional regulator, nickel/cobalt-responsive transcriptional repressor